MLLKGLKLIMLAEQWLLFVYLVPACNLQYHTKFPC